MGDEVAGAETLLTGKGLPAGTEINFPKEFP